MVGLPDARDALVAAVTAAVYPNGTNQPSISGTGIKVFAGWPQSADLNADLAANKTEISVFPKPGGRNTTRYPESELVLIPATPTLTLTQSGQVVTVGGTISVPQNVGLLINGKPYAHGVLANDTLSSIASSLASVVGASISGTHSSGPSLTVGPTGRIQACRVGASATIGTEVRRQERVIMVTVWAPTPALRDQIGIALDIALSQIEFLTLPYGYGARLINQSDNQSDSTQKQNLYRWDFNYLVEYPVVEIDQAAQVLFPVTVYSTPNTTPETFYT